MKIFLSIFIFSFIVSKAFAGIIEANYSYDGTSFTLESGEDIFNVDYQVGDTLKLTIVAKETGSYWDFSGYNTQSFRGFDLGFTESAYRGIDGMYRFYFDNTRLIESYFYNTLDDYRGGPYSLSVRDINLVDKVSIDYRLLDSSALSNQIASFDAFGEDWAIWNTFGNGNTRVPFFNGQSVDVSEPGGFYLFMLAMLGVATFSMRRRVITS